MVSRGSKVGTCERDLGPGTSRETVLTIPRRIGDTRSDAGMGKNGRDWVPPSCEVVNLPS
jgi:hypothetical protein